MAAKVYYKITAEHFFGQQLFLEKEEVAEMLQKLKTGEKILSWSDYHQMIGGEVVTPLNTWAEPKYQSKNKNWAHK